MEVAPFPFLRHPIGRMEHLVLIDGHPSSSGFTSFRRDFAGQATLSY